ncbi:MAG: SRPBCC family protein [Myxococcota bacterium]
MTAVSLDPRLDLVLERVVPVPPAKVWAAWTTPALLEQWFCPVPWRATDFVIDLRPGGAFDCVMRGPAGETQPQRGCLLEVVPERRLVWTDALLAGYRPSGAPFMTGMLQLEPTATGTRYTAIARHADPATADKHREMGFEAGWGAALDQLVALVG